VMNAERYNYTVWRSLTKETLAAAKGIVEDKYIEKVDKGLQKLDEAVELMMNHNKSGKFMLIAIQATPLQKSMFLAVLAWLHLWSLTVSVPKMKRIIGEAKGAERQKIVDDNAEAAYYTGRVLSSQFYIGSEFPKYFGMIDSILEGEPAVVKASTAVYTGALEG
jgi:hypothetical protein